ncbi:MAG: transporter substrate-binding domain-containing protein [Christensenellales bacterium]|jgi:ABC-type amino acid transport substrate-binding protein
MNKKIIALMLGLTLLCVALAGCGKQSTLDKIEKNNKVVWGTNAYFMPFEIREGEDVIGVDAEIAAAVAEKLGVELVVEDMEFESLISALEAGTVDFVGAGMTITDERKEKADFSTGYWTAVQVVTVAADDESVLTVGDLSSLVIGVQSGTTGDFVAEELSNNPDTGIMRYNTVIEAMQDLKNGNIDCVIADDLPSQAIVSQTEGLKILDLQPSDKETYAFAVKKGDTELLAVINEVLTEMMESGEIEELVNKYSLGQ